MDRLQRQQVVWSSLEVEVESKAFREESDNSLTSFPIEVAEVFTTPQGVVGLGSEGTQTAVREVIKAYTLAAQEERRILLAPAGSLLFLLTLPTEEMESECRAE